MDSTPLARFEEKGPRECVAVPEECSEAGSVLEMLLVLVYLVFMFGIPVTTERVWIDSISSVERDRRALLRDRVVAIAGATAV